MLNLIWRVSLHPAVNLSVCSYVNGQLVLDALLSVRSQDALH